jgi:hypothetical protein
MLQNARLTHDGLGFLTNLSRDLERITLLESRQEELH